MEISQLIIGMNKYRDLNEEVINTGKNIKIFLAKRNSNVQYKKDLIDKLGKELEINSLSDVSDILSEIQAINLSIIVAENTRIFHYNRCHSLLIKANKLKLVELNSDDFENNENIEIINNDIKKIKISIEKDLINIMNNIDKMFFNI